MLVFINTPDSSDALALCPRGGDPCLTVATGFVFSIFCKLHNKKLCKNVQKVFRWWKLEDEWRQEKPWGSHPDHERRQGGPQCRYVHPKGHLTGRFGGCFDSLGVFFSPPHNRQRLFQHLKCSSLYATRPWWENTARSFSEPMSQLCLSAASFTATASLKSTLLVKCVIL